MTAGLTHHMAMMVIESNKYYHDKEPFTLVHHDNLVAITGDSGPLVAVQLEQRIVYFTWDCRYTAESMAAKFDLMKRVVSIEGLEALVDGDTPTFIAELMVGET